MTMEKATEVMDLLNDPKNYEGARDLLERGLDTWQIRLYDLNGVAYYSVFNTFDRLTFADIEFYTKLADNPCYGIYATNNHKVNFALS